MGGLVVKQAYILGRSDSAYREIVESISAILFLSTPHRGSDLAEIFQRTLKALNPNSNFYISELRSKSKTIETLNDQFRHIAPKLDILSFYETRQTFVGGAKLMVVEKASAILGYPDEIPIPLNADHHNVCKFDNPQDPNYISIRNGLKTLVTTVLSRGQHLLSEQWKTQMDRLKTLLATPDTYQDDLKFFHDRWTPSTCGWILLNPRFTQWADKGENGSTILWLHALPASGKSILSSFIVSHLLEKSVCVYYFFRFGDPLKRSVSNCLRSLAFQIAEQLPEFRHALNSAQFSTGTLENANAKTIWERVYIGVLFKMRFKTTMHWVIDALDESDHSKILVELMQSISRSLSPIKVLLVSRQTLDLISVFERLATAVSVVYLPIEDTKRDIQIYVETEMEYVRAPLEIKSQIIERLVAGASGNFLWASLVLDEVKKCNTLEDLNKTLEGMPRGVEQLYERMERAIIERTDESAQRLGQMILTWTACSRRPLALKELEQALQPEYGVILDLKSAIGRVCDQFVVVDSTDQLVMIHQTARDHIIATDSALAVNVTDGHERLFKTCLSALDQRRDMDLRFGNQKTVESQEFILYAMTSWAYHLNMTSPESEEPLLLLPKFLKGKSVLAWIVLLAQHKRLEVLVSSSKSMNLYVRRKRALYSATNPMLHRLQELDLLEGWATDFLKLLGKFGRNLMDSPTSIYLQIPPFCPKNSMIYRHFEQRTSPPHALSVKGLSNFMWNDGLAKISLGRKSQGLTIVCSGNYFTVLTTANMMILYNSTTLEVKQTLMHREWIFVMSFSISSNLLVTYGDLTTKVWSVRTGEILYEISNPIGIRAITIVFSAGDTELVVGSNDNLIRVARLTDANPVWSILHEKVLIGNTALGKRVHSMPWRMAFNSNASRVAVAYRNSPLCVWATDPPELIRNCMRNQEYDGNSWTTVDQVIWHPNSEEVLGLYMGGYVFRWNPENDTQQELQAKASLLACSPDGKLFATGDSNGTIKLYNFHHFALIYQLSCPNMLDDICFSPDGKRLYDLRGQFCSIWEPNALIRLCDTSQEDSEGGSEMASIPTASVSEAFAEVREQITAIAIQFQGRYQAIGDDAGVVSVVDSLGDHAAIQLWRSPVVLPIRLLDWSGDGNYLACVELTGDIVVQKVQREDSVDWTATEAFSVDPLVGSADIHQILLNSDGKVLLVIRDSSATIWHLGLPPTSEAHKKSIASLDAKWSKHPTDSTLLMAFSPSHIRVYLWDDLSEIAVLNIGRPSLLPSPDASKTNKPVRAARVDSIFTDALGTHFLVDLVLTTENETHLTFICESSAMARPTESQPPLIFAPTFIPQKIQEQIEIPLGILSEQQLIFLDKEYWMCSWHLGANFTTEKVQRHYFLPKDWLDVESLKMCALLADGKFVIPNNGELAIIKAAEIGN